MRRMLDRSLAESCLLKAIYGGLLTSRERRWMRNRARSLRNRSWARLAGAMGYGVKITIIESDGETYSYMER